MFNTKKILIPETVTELNKDDIIFVNSDKIANADITDRNIYRLIEFVNNFLDGAAAVKCRKTNTGYSIHKMHFEAYDINSTKLRECKETFSIPLTKFKLMCLTDFFADADYMILHLYVTFNGNVKKGSVINIKLDFK